MQSRHFRRAANIEPDLFESTPQFLPALLSDETLYSWCARYHRLSGNSLAIKTSQQLFGSSSAGLLQDFPSHLSTLVERTEGQLGDIETLANHHTLLGFYAAFCSMETSQRTIVTMSGASVEHLKFQLGLPGSGHGAAHPLKACPVCMQKDQQQVGFAYWHLEHQWPAVWVCLSHQVPLWSYVGRSNSLNSRQLMLPDDINDQYREIQEQAIYDGWHILERMARYARQCQQIGDLPLEPLRLRHTYMAELKKTGRLTRSGMIRLKEIRADFLQEAGSLEAIHGFGFISSVQDRRGGLLGLLLNAARGHKHPVKHLLLMAFLFSSWQDFWDTYQAMPTAPEQWQARDLLREDDKLRQKLAELIKTDGLTVSESARRLGVTQDSALYWARKDKLPYRVSPRRLQAAMLPALHEAIHRGETRPAIAKQLGIPARAVTRYLNSHPDIQARWDDARLTKQRETNRASYLEVLAAHPGASLTFLRTLAGCSYIWLCQHDRDWLSENMPSLWQVRQKK